MEQTNNQDSNKYSNLISASGLKLIPSTTEMGRVINAESINSEQFFQGFENYFSFLQKNNLETVNQYSGKEEFIERVNASQKILDDYPSQYSSYELLKTEMLKDENLKYFVCERFNRDVDTPYGCYNYWLKIFWCDFGSERLEVCDGEEIIESLGA